LLSEDLVIKVKPGLSSFSNDPEKAIGSIKPLLDKAIQVIPKSEHAITRLTLKATAGLRMVSDEIAYKILNNVNNLSKFIAKYLQELRLNAILVRFKSYLKRIHF
jgi:Golgi nucleoside diphosphatase